MADGATATPSGRALMIGTHRVRGFAKGASMSVTYNADTNAVNMGLDGEGYYVQQDDDSATITVTLLESSESNDVLSALFLTDKNSAGGLVVPVLIRDTTQGGRTIAAAATAKISKLPDVGWSETGETRVWTIITTKMISFVGGIGVTAENPDQVQNAEQAAAAVL